MTTTTVPRPLEDGPGRLERLQHEGGIRRTGRSGVSVAELGSSTGER